MALAVAVLVFAGALVAAVWLSWRYNAQVIAVSLVVFAALVLLPRFFVTDGIFLSEARSMPAQRLSLVAGLNVGALGLALLAFLVVGFVAPLIGAWLAVRRRSKGAWVALRVHLGILAAAVAVAVLPMTPVWREAHFTVMQEMREKVVRDLAAGAVEAKQAGQRRDLKTHAPAAAFPRLACCGNVVYVLDDGRRILFPMTTFGPDAWGYVHMDDVAGDAPPLRTLAKLGGGWRRVAINWTEAL